MSVGRPCAWGLVANSASEQAQQGIGRKVTPAHELHLAPNVDLGGRRESAPTYQPD